MEQLQDNVFGMLHYFLVHDNFSEFVSAAESCLVLKVRSFLS